MIEPCSLTNGVRERGLLVLSERRGSGEQFVRADVGVRMEEDSEKIDLIGRLALIRVKIRVSAELWIRSDRMGEKKGRTSAHHKKP